MTEQLSTHTARGPGYSEGFADNLKLNSGKNPPKEQLRRRWRPRKGREGTSRPPPPKKKKKGKRLAEDHKEKGKWMSDKHNNRYPLSKSKEN